MDSTIEGRWIEIDSISKNADEFIDAIKYLIYFENKPYEFNTDYTKVRRIEYVATKAVKPNQKAK